MSERSLLFLGVGLGNPTQGLIGILPELIGLLLFELVLTWTQAAFATDRIGMILSGSTPEPRAP
jgi:hypothetical protein